MDDFFDKNRGFALRDQRARFFIHAGVGVFIGNLEVELAQDEFDVMILARRIRGIDDGMKKRHTVNMALEHLHKTKGDGGFAAVRFRGGNVQAVRHDETP